MRILTISGAFAPHRGGGAEQCAYDLSIWLAKQGHQVGVLTAAITPEEVTAGDDYHGLKVWRVCVPRPYTLFDKRSAILKPLWYAAEFFASGNRKATAQALDDFRPDCVVIHAVQGLGHNILLEIAKRSIPTVYFLHDLGIVCLNRGMFRGQRNCADQCFLCRLGSQLQLTYLRKIPQLTFCSPSRALLTRAEEYFPLSEFKAVSELNASYFYPPTKAWKESEEIRLLFVGRLHPSKGAKLLFSVCEALALKHKFTLTIVGGGEEEAALREAAKEAPWCRIVGRVDPREVGDYMVESDLLCAPSQYLAENSPGVIVQALSLGLPVVASNVGGIPELVEDGKSGRLLPMDDRAAWIQALDEILQSAALLKSWRAYSKQNAFRFSQDRLGERLLDVIHRASLKS